MSGLAALDKPVRPATLRRGEAAEENEAKWKEVIELNGVEEECDKMSDEAEGETDDEGEIVVPDWKVRAGPRKNQQKEKEKSMKQHTCHFVTGACTA